MKKVLPKIPFVPNAKLDIVVKTIAELYDELIQIDDHDPFAPHRIEFYYIVVLSYGSYSHFVDFQFYHLKEGSVLFISKNQIHHFTEQMKNVKGFCIGLNAQFVENNYFRSDKIKLNRLYNYNIESPVIHQEDIGNDTFLGIASGNNYEFHYPNNIAKSEMLQAMVDILLLKAERIKNGQSNGSVKIKWIEIFNAFKDLLQIDYVNSRSAKTYASRLFISYKLLNDIVKKLSNSTAKAFIDSFITLEIKRYLISTSSSINEISHITGFDEAGHMITFFKKNVGTTPLKFRQQS